MLGQEATAEAFRKSGLSMSPHNPEARLRSALVLAQLHKDSEALDELKSSLEGGLSVTEVTNNPAWQRFAGNPEFAAIVARKERKSPQHSH
jgi:hypothetical protein